MTTTWWSAQEPVYGDTNYGRGAAMLRRIGGLLRKVVRRKKKEARKNGPAFMLEGWKVYRNTERPFLGREIMLHLFPDQLTEGVLGRKLMLDLWDEPVLGSNALAHYLAHPDQIPKAIEEELNNGKRVAFWATLYVTSQGDLCVLCLVRSGSRTGWIPECLNDRLGGDCLAAMVAA